MTSIPIRQPGQKVYPAFSELETDWQDFCILEQRTPFELHSTDC